MYQDRLTRHIICIASCQWVGSLEACIVLKMTDNILAAQLALHRQALPRLLPWRLLWRQQPRRTSTRLQMSSPKQLLVSADVQQAPCTSPCPDYFMNIVLFWLAASVQQLSCAAFARHVPSSCDVRSSLSAQVVCTAIAKGEMPSSTSYLDGCACFLQRGVRHRRRWLLHLRALCRRAASPRWRLPAPMHTQSLSSHALA